MKGNFRRKYKVSIVYANGSEQLIATYTRKENAERMEKALVKIKSDPLNDNPFLEVRVCVVNAEPKAKRLTIRDFAKKHNHQVVGQLTRRPDWEYTTDPINGSKKHSGCRHYCDEAGNEYIVSKTGCSIVTSDNSVI